MTDTTLRNTTTSHHDTSTSSNTIHYSNCDEQEEKSAMVMNEKQSNVNSSSPLPQKKKKEEEKVQEKKTSPPIVVVPSKPAWGISKIVSSAATTTSASVVVTSKNMREQHPNNASSSCSTSKISFASIMAQEEKEAAERKQYQQQEQQDPELLRAIQESLQVTASTTATNGDDFGTVMLNNNSTNTIHNTLELDDMDEDMRRAIELSLQQQPPPQQQQSQPLQETSITDTNGALLVENSLASASCTSATATAASVGVKTSANNLSEREVEEIEAAIRAADAAEAAESLQLAFQLQNEENKKKRSVTQEQKQKNRRQQQHHQGNVRIMTHDQLWQEEYEKHTSLGSQGAATPVRYSADDVMGDHHHHHHCDSGDDDDNNDDYGTNASAGYRINASQPSSSWSRIDQNTIVGPNNELRTKHDVVLQGQANAHRLGLDCYYEEEDVEEEEENYDEEGIGRQKRRGGSSVHVGNKAFNSFRASMQKKTIKGVAAHGHGRATADTDRTRGGAMDAKVRLEITRAINNGLMEVCNGVVKEGKEALVYHGQEGVESGGYDVAVKVFKRIQEFKQRGLYVDGDPRYHRQNFTKASSREQLSLWAEKEYRNLIRANRAGVPVPTPLLQRENILFMRFLGDDGWPSPQLKELDIKRGSKKWTALYLQAMTAIKMLYHKGRLVHGDLSEYNLMVCPCHLVENTLNEDAKDEAAVQIVMIDFGQAVDVRHPNALELLRRDLLRVKEFFDKMGTKTMSPKAAEEFVVTKDEGDEESEDEGDDQEGTKPKTGVTANTKNGTDQNEEFKTTIENKESKIDA